MAEKQFDAVDLAIAMYQAEELVKDAGRKRAKERRSRTLAEVLAELEVPEGYTSRLKTEADRLAREKPVWLVEGRIPGWGVGQIYGPSWEGKSFVAIDLAMRVANDNELWHGGKINRHGAVVYALMEGVYDINERIEAWLLAHRDDRSQPDSHNLYTLEEESLDLADAESIALMCYDIWTMGVEPQLVIVDTQALATPGTNESDNTEMGIVMSYLKQLSRLLNCPVVTVHHTGKDAERGARGASAVRAALDVEIQVADEKTKFTKLKAGKAPDKWDFELRPAGDSVWAAPKDKVAAAADALENAQTRLEANIVRYITEADTGYLTKNSVRMRLSQANRLRLDDALARLVDSGQLVQTERGYELP